MVTPQPAAPGWHVVWGATATDETLREVAHGPSTIQQFVRIAQVVHNELGAPAIAALAEPNKGVDAHKSPMPRGLDTVFLINEVNLGIGSLDDNIRAARTIILTVANNSAFQLTYRCKRSDLLG